MEQPETPPRRIYTQGAGILVLARDTGRFLALKRSDHVRFGRTWALAGGLVEPGENPAEGAAREFCEETGYKGQDFDLIPLVEHHSTVAHHSKGFTYSNFLAVVDHEFQPDLDHENEGYAWVDSLDDWPEPAHFGIEFLKNHAESMSIIKAEHDAVKSAHKTPPARPSYPPTLYHIEPGLKKGEDIKTYNGKVHATKNPREAMASLTPKNVRIANAQLPGSEDFITIIENRAEFLKNGKYEGVVIVLSGEKFSQKIKDGAPTEHWVANDNIPVKQRGMFDKIRSVEDVMYYGVHVLFTPGPVTEEEKKKIRDAVKSPDFPENIKQMVKDGTLVYENAVRDVHVSSKIQPDMKGEEVRNKPDFVRVNRSGSKTPKP